MKNIIVLATSILFDIIATNLFLFILKDNDYNDYF